jgi:UDP-glucose 4-epimerase
MKSWEGKRILVTGGAGFIGSHLVDGLLTEGAEHVAIVDNFFLGKESNLTQATEKYKDKIVVYREDAAELSSMESVCKAEKPDVVFNLATKALLYSFFNPPGAYRVNVDIAENFGELLRKKVFGKLIHVSTSEVYGTARQNSMAEDHPLMAETSYAAGKAAADLFLTSYVNMFDLDITIVRPFNNYGPRQNEGALAAVIPETMKRIRSGQEPFIEGDGLQTRDFIYVKDTVKNLLQLSSLPEARGKIFNLGSGKETAIKSIIETLSEIMGYSGEIKMLPERPADVRRHCANMDSAKNLLGEISLTSLKEGLQKTVNWYQS